MTDSQKVKCPGCGTMFTPKHKNQKFHTPACGNQARNQAYQQRLREARAELKECRDELQVLLQRLHERENGDG
jgi:predicted RNA-binding Zn-ribbon protein involved in translation (DUF1610 family)